MRSKKAIENYAKGLVEVQASIDARKRTPFERPGDDAAWADCDLLLETLYWVLDVTPEK